MKYTALYGGEERQIEVFPRGEYTYLVKVDEHQLELDTRFCTPDQLSLLINNQSYNVSFFFKNEHVEMNFLNQIYQVKILDERKLRMRQVESALQYSGPETIKTSMPGKVVKLLVKEGDPVAPGTGIIIVEAMKMENEIQCQNGGTVKHIAVVAGQTVESNTVLVEIAPEDKD